MNLTLPVSGAWRTTAIDLGQWLPGGSADGRNRRIPVVAERPGEGPFAMRFADLRHGGLRGAGSALASRLRAGWMEARVEGGQGFGKVFEVFGRRRLRQPSSRAMDELLPWRVWSAPSRVFYGLPSGTKPGTKLIYLIA